MTTKPLSQAMPHAGPTGSSSDRALAAERKAWGERLTIRVEAEEWASSQAGKPVYAAYCHGEWIYTGMPSETISDVREIARRRIVNFEV